MATSNYSWNLPTVGGSEDTWGTDLNANWTDLDTLLGGVSQTEFAILDGATVSTAELNLLDGATVTTAELNKLDGFTGSAADLNYAKDLRATGVTAAEFDKLDGLTSTTAELNKLDGLTSTTAELNKLDGLTASTAELNLLDGVTWTLTDYNALTATATELNLLDGVTGKTGADNVLVTGTAGTDGQLAQWNADGDIVGASGTLPEADWEAGTSTSEALVSPAKVKAAIDALGYSGFDSGQVWQSVSRSGGVTYRNTTGRAIQVSLNYLGTATVYFQVSQNGSSWLSIATFDDDAENFTGIIPNGTYYRVSSGSFVWRELR